MVVPRVGGWFTWPNMGSDTARIVRFLPALGQLRDRRRVMECVGQMIHNEKVDTLELQCDDTEAQPEPGEQLPWPTAAEELRPTRC